MRGIESHLDPGGSVAVSAVLHVVVADDVPATGGPHHHDLVHVPDDVVLDQVVGGVPREGDAVAAATGEGLLGAVEVGVAHDAAERGIDAHARPVLEIGLDVPDPAVGGIRERDVALAAAATG